MQVARSSRARGLLLACALLCRTPRVLADETAVAPEVNRTGHPALPSRFTDRPLTFDAVLGFGTPVGLLGVAVQYDLANAVSVGGGVGTNIAGAQLAALLRVRPLVWERSELAVALEIGGAFATGRYGGQVAALVIPAGEGGTGETDPNAQTYALDRVYWAQLDVGLELKTRSGFHALAAPGLAVPLNAASGSCHRVDTGRPVACERRLVDRGDPWPTALVPGVFTVMLGWSI